MKRFLVALITVALATSAVAQPAPAPQGLLRETVSVTGTGRSAVVPDRFTFNVGVQTLGNTVEEAINENNRKVAAVVAALKRAGAADADIQTSTFTIWPQQDYQEGRLPRILGYQVSNQIAVRSAKVADAGRLLGVAIGAGVNTSSGINFEVTDPARGRDQGLRNAFNDARAKARLLAQAAGRDLGAAISIAEGAPAVPPQPFQTRAAMAMEAKVADVPIEAGTQETTYTVTVVFALQ